MSVSVIPLSLLFSFMRDESLLSFSDMSRTLAASEDSRVQSQIAHSSLFSPTSTYSSSSPTRSTLILEDSDWSWQGYGEQFSDDNISEVSSDVEMVTVTLVYPQASGLVADYPPTDGTFTCNTSRSPTIHMTSPTQKPLGPRIACRLTLPRPSTTYPLPREYTFEWPLANLCVH